MLFFNINIKLSSTSQLFLASWFSIPVSYLFFLSFFLSFIHSFFFNEVQAMRARQMEEEEEEDEEDDHNKY